jgi:hypothetical protein
MIQTYFRAKVGFHLLNFFFLNFYWVLLFRATGNLTVILVEPIIYFAAFTFSGALVYLLVAPRTTFYQLYISAFTLTAITAIITVVIFDQIASLFWLLAILRGLTRAVFWVANDLAELSEMESTKRGRQINLFTSINLLMDITVPVFIGFIIVNANPNLGYENYKIIILIGAIISCLMVLILPRNNKRIQFDGSFKFNQYLKNKAFRYFAGVLFFRGGITTSYEMVFRLLPFLIILNEFNLGIFMAAISVVGSIFIFILRNIPVEKQDRFTLSGLGLITLSNILLIFNFNFVFLTIRSAFNSIGETLYNPNFLKYTIKIKEKFMNKFKADPIEVTFLSEIFQGLGRVFFLIVFFILYLYLNSDYQLLFKIIIVTNIVWNFVSFYVWKKESE